MGINNEDMDEEGAKGEVEQLKELVENLSRVVTHQEEVIAHLRARLNEDSTNSHHPPSTDGPKARAKIGRAHV